MKFEVIVARNGEKSLRINGYWLYSRYSPIEEANKWIDKEFDENACNYILIGLGLGYHLLRLAEKTDKEIYVLVFDSEELTLYKEYITFQKTNIHFMNNLNEIKITNQTQILLPHSWVKIMKSNPKVYGILDTIKRNQISFKKFKDQMSVNAIENLKDFIYTEYPKKTAKTACLVSSGPSLNETISWLENAENLEIYAVGSALKTLLKNRILPDAVVITDAQHYVQQQLDEVNYTGDLYYLLTADSLTVKKHKGPKYLLCQEGYTLAEYIADKWNMPVFATGGSVATTAFSLLEYKGYENLVLFGQDLGFPGEYTHALGSTSGKKVQTNLKVKANDGTFIKTQPNLQVYLRWFNEQCMKTNMKVYNMALKGAVINNVPLITKEDFDNLKA